MNKYLENYLEWVKLDEALTNLKKKSNMQTGQNLLSSTGIIRYMKTYVPHSDHHEFFMELMPSLKKITVTDFIRGYNGAKNSIYEYEVLVMSILEYYMGKNDLTRVRENLKYLTPYLLKEFLSRHGHTILKKTRNPIKVMEIVIYMKNFDEFTFNKTLKAINDYPIKSSNYKYKSWKKDILNMKFNKEQKEQVLAAIMLKELS